MSVSRITHPPLPRLRRTGHSSRIRLRRGYGGQVTHHPSLITLLIALLLPLLCAPLLAQSDQAEVTVVVTAERTPQPANQSISTATVITAKEIREQGAQTVADVLRLVPGVTLRQSGQMGAAASVRTRGTDARQTLVLVDGERVSSPAFIGGTDLSKFPITDVARIEVIRGPVSSLYGSEAIGGVINIITRQKSGNAGDAALSFGSHGRSSRSLSLNGSGDRMTWQLTGSVPAYSGAQANSDYSATTMSARMLLPSVKGWQVSLRGDNYRDSLGLPGTAAFPSPNDHQWWDRTTLDLGANRKTGAGQLEWHLYQAKQQLTEVNPDWFLDARITGISNVGEMNYRWESGKHQWIVGTEYRHEDYKDIESSAVAQRKNIINRGVFVQDRMSIGPKASLVLGTRFDDHSAAGSSVTPRAGITYALGANTHLRASYGEGFRAPSLVELYYNGMYGTGNPDLRPEKSRQYEIGMNLAKGSDALDIALFLNNVRDQIDWVSDPITWVGTYENISRARQQGIEVAWAHRLAGSTSLNLSYTYLDARNLTAGTRLLGTPHNQVAMTIARPMGSWQTALSARWTDDRPDYGGTIVGGRMIFDLTLARPGAKPTSPYIVVRNLTNVKYEEVAGYPAERLSIEVGMKSTW